MAPFKIGGNRLVISVTRWTLALLFIYAGVSKIVNPIGFYGAIKAYKLVPNYAAAIAAFYLPNIELVVGICVLVNRAKRAASATVIVLGTIFAIFGAAAWFRGLDVSCGCFGSGSNTNQGVVTFRAIGIIILGCYNLYHVLFEECYDNAGSSPIIADERGKC